MADTIRHIGTVEQIRKDGLTVRILQAGACSGCHAAGMCTSSESREKSVDIYTADARKYHIGDKIMIEGSTEGGLRAVLLAYVTPIIIIVLVIAIGTLYMSEASAALLSLVAVAAYYALLTTQKQRLAKRFTFRITS